MPVMMLSEMFADQEAETFEQRRDEVVSIISAATDLAGAERGLRPFVDDLCTAVDEHEFDDVYIQLVDRLSSSLATTSGTA